MQVYLDNSATTRPFDEVIAAMNKSMTEQFYNPSALYTPAVHAERALKEARCAIAVSLQANEKNVIFTSGGTESDNLAIWGHLQCQRHPGEVLYTAAEHAAVKNACIEAQERFGCIAREIPLLANGSVDLDALESMMPKRRKKKQTTVANAVKILKEEEAKKLINMDDVTTLALEAAQRDGIIFIDEIDKIGSKGSGHGPDVSREGVQRDFLPIVEGTTVNTKYGVVKTDHILFIAAGAFHMTKVTDLIPELQGRFPIRVELSSLSENDFKQILTDPENALIKQETALLETEDVHLVFTDDAIAQIAHMAYMMNETMEEIGARRLHTVMETLLEEISFSADEHQGQTFTIDADYVKTRLEKVYKETNLNKYIL